MTNKKTQDKRDTMIDDSNSPVKPVVYKATPVPNAEAAVNGLYLPSWKIDGDVMPKKGDTITITWRGKTITGYVNRVLTNDTVLLYIA